MTGASVQALGSGCALLSAACWAAASLWWRRFGEEMSPWAMNLAKGLLGVLYLGAVLLVLGRHPVSAREAWLLAGSGLLGITLGDSLYFMSLVRLGARLATLLGTLGPVFTALLAVAFLGERPSAAGWLGIAMVVAGVAWVLQAGRARGQATVEWRTGVPQGLLAVLCSSLGTVLAKRGTATTPALEGTMIRVAVGAAALLAFGACRGQSRRWLSEVLDRGRLPRLAALVLMVTFGGFWLSLFALRHADAWLVATLLSTVPLFTLAFSAAFLGERPGAGAVAGTLLAVAGAAVAWLRA